MVLFCFASYVSEVVEPTQVRIGMMDITRPQEVAVIPARHLGWLERVWRAMRRTLGISGTGLLIGNILLMMLPFPHLHLCLFPIALVLGPLLGWFAWRDRVELASAQLPCPRCHGTVTVPEGLHGWPARFNCAECGIMVELQPVVR
jgi:hypothetical protein